MLDTNLGFKSRRHIDEERRRPRVQPGGADDLHVHMARVGEFLCRYRRFAIALACKTRDDVSGIACFRQSLCFSGVIEHVGQSRKDSQVLIRARRDADHKPHGLAGIPFNAVRHLHDRDAGAMDQLAVLLHAVRNRDPVAEIGVRLLLSAKHALDVSGRDVAGFDRTCPAARMASSLFLGLA